MLTIMMRVWPSIVMCSIWRTIGAYTLRIYSTSHQNFTQCWHDELPGNVSVSLVPQQLIWLFYCARDLSRHVD